MATQPFSGATTPNFYVAETITGVTPDNPVWLPLRSTAGMPSVTRDAITSAEIGDGREVSFVSSGNEQVTGEFAVEYSQSSQDDLLAAAMTSSWVAGESIVSVSVTVNAAAKTFTRATGDFTTQVEVGDLIYFADLTGDNAKPFFATTVTPLAITGAGIQHKLTNESKATTGKTGDKIGTGNECKSVSTLTWLKGKCGNPDAMLVTSGVEFTGFTMEQAVNAAVTGSLPFIGRKQVSSTTLPTGSTFPAQPKAEPFKSVNVSVFDGITPLINVDTVTFTNDNEASAQFGLGDNGVSFIDRGLATNTFSMSGKLGDLNLINKFLNDTDLTINSLLSGAAGAMSITLNKCRLTEATPERGSSGAITLSLSGQATGSANQSSITIQRLVY